MMRILFHASYAYHRELATVKPGYFEWRVKAAGNLTFDLNGRQPDFIASEQKR